VFCCNGREFASLRKTYGEISLAFNQNEIKQVVVFTVRVMLSFPI